MPSRRWLLPLALLLALPLLGGCAKLNEWLEGTVGEEEESTAKTPEEELAEQQEILKTGEPAKRKAAMTKITTLKIAPALEVVIQGLGDADSGVVSASLSGLQTVTGFPEKTDDERQLDPEGYQLQLDFKQAVIEQGLAGLSAAIQRDDDNRFGGLIVLYNLGRAPVVPDDALNQLRDRTSDSLVKLVKDDAAPLDTRELAVDVLVLYGATDKIAELVPVLDSPEAELRGQVALSLGEVGAKSPEAESKLLALATDGGQPWDVRWRAAAALGRLGASNTGGLQAPFDPPLPEELQGDPENPDEPSPLEAYRSYALSNATDPQAQAVVAQLNQEMDQLATAAEDRLAAEKKKGYR